MEFVRGGERNSHQSNNDGPNNHSVSADESDDSFENTIFNIGDESSSSTHHASSSEGYLSEEQQIKMAQRIGLINHLPLGTFDGMKKKRECVICMMDFDVGDKVRYLPCLHIYHQECIDDWLMRSFTCPSCVEPVDAALISTFYTSE
ncbi:RING finger protein 11-like [Clytia hemisphaerica]|uniref:RING-type domain-containing protein n=1 Tax=Clytia hemisphaerica TaxID=252671 RepID=A0A7M5XDS5_9CNID